MDIPESFAHFDNGDGEAGQTRYRLYGQGDNAVVLDSGIRDSKTAWAAIAQHLSAFARVLEVDQTREGATISTIGDLDPDRQVAMIVRLIDQHLSGARLTLVGWSFGAIYAERLAESLQNRINGVVLIDPLPTSAITAWLSDGLTTEMLASDRAPAVDLAVLVERFGVDLRRFTTPSGLVNSPVTVILPGIRPALDDELAIRVSSLQQTELKRFPRLRETIAGRSNFAIPIERPDTIIDAIQHYCLATS